MSDDSTLIEVVAYNVGKWLGFRISKIITSIYPAWYFLSGLLISASFSGYSLVIGVTKPSEIWLLAVGFIILWPLIILIMIPSIWIRYDPFTSQVLLERALYLTITGILSPITSYYILKWRERIFNPLKKKLRRGSQSERTSKDSI